MKRSVLVGSALLFLVAIMAVERPQAGGSSGGSRFADVSALAVPGGALTVSVDPRLKSAKGQIDLVVGMIDAPLAVAHGPNFKQHGGKLNPGQQKAYLRQLGQKQDALMSQIRGLGGRELGRVGKAHNALVISIDASRIKDIEALPGIKSVRPLINYELALSETVPYIGASAVQAEGFDGTGVRVAVLDTGIDYTHAFFGGAGTAAAYTAAYGTTTSDPRNTTLDGLFPTAKVVGGYDFVGEVWPTPDPARCGFNANGTPRACIIGDPDPIDCGPNAIPAPCGGTPGSTPEVISAAQTQVPSAIKFPLVISSPAAIAGTYANTETVDWAPIGAGFTNQQVVFIGRGCPDGSGAGVPPGGDPYQADPAGKIALIDRGVCAVSLKVDRAADAGAVGVLIGLVAAGDAISFSYGGGDTFVPTLVIQQSLSTQI